MDEKIEAEIRQALNDIILDVMPDATMLEKYGGTMIEKIAGQPNSQCCGYFTYKHHLSLEFTNGILLHDVDGFLEGSGKQRRHIKLISLEEVKTKNCRYFLDQASKL